MLQCISRAIHVTRPSSVLKHVSRLHTLSGKSRVFGLCLIWILTSVIIVTVIVPGTVYNDFASTLIPLSLFASWLVNFL